jgi:hypothetical protein
MRTNAAEHPTETDVAGAFYGAYKARRALGPAQQES